MPKWIFFDSFKTNTINGTGFINFNSDTIKVALITSIVTPNISIHEFWSALQVTEVSGSNYTLRGNTLITKRVREFNGVVTFDADDVTWTFSLTGFANARHAILYKDTGNNITAPLIATLNLESDRSNISTDLVLVMASTGIFTVF